MASISQLYALYKQNPTVCIDSRKVTVGCIFFALKGETFDGNKFAYQALEQGAAAAVVDDPSLEIIPGIISVENVLLALQELATCHRDHFQMPVIGIAGSNGKTTTKELVARVLAGRYACHCTKGNLNNHIGVPLTLLAMPDDTEVAVIEMGANHIGEVAELCRIAKPTHGVLTNIGKEHLEGFGSLEGVKQAEGELYAYLKMVNGPAFVNLDEKYLKSMSAKLPKRVFYFKSDLPDPNTVPIEVQFLSENPFIKVGFLDEQRALVAAQTQIAGTYNFANIMTAVAIGKYFKVPGQQIKAALESYCPSNNRSQWIQKDSNTVFMDAYNANPSSMIAALESMANLKAQQKIAIMGDMLELGDHSPKEHQLVLNYALKKGFDQICLVGEAFGSTTVRAKNVTKFADTEQLKPWFEAQQFKNTLIFIKGSRGIRLEKLLETNTI